MKKDNNFSRRDFLKISSIASLPLLLGGMPLYSSLPNRKNLAFSSINDKILVLIQLGGGNDGLNTLFDYNQYDNLQAVRSNIIVPSSSLLNLNNGYALHPSLSGLKNVWESEQLSFIHSIGYPNQNRSHFRSTDILHTASDAEQYLNSGWIGRYFDLFYSDFPENYPNPSNPHPFALTIGNIINECCQGSNANYSLTLSDPSNPSNVNGNSNQIDQADIPANCYGNMLDYVNKLSDQTNQYAVAISEAYNQGNNLSTLYQDNDISKALQKTARLIAGGMQTKVYTIKYSGFDTHNRQVVDGDPLSGTHSNLLEKLSDAIKAFQDDLNQLGLSDRVVGMTYSEFGRKIRSNAGFGTDHGDASAQFFFGSCINHQILGNSPTIDPQVGTGAGVPMQYDFRDIYGTVLQDWFGASEADVKNIINPNFTPLPIFKASCIEDSLGNTTTDSYIDLALYPNPCQDVLNISFQGHSQQVKITLTNLYGRKIKTITDSIYARTNHTISQSVRHLPSGVYLIHFQSINIKKTIQFIKE